MRHRHWLLIMILATSLRCFAQAGPPFLTDDPDPVPRNHFEAYIFTLSDGTRAGTSFIGPGYEMNYGAAKNLQLHLVLPFTNAYSPDDPTSQGLGDTEFGAKYKLLDEKKFIPEIGVFPFIEFPTGNPKRNLGVGKTWYRVPIWLRKQFGDWSVFGGGGEVVIPADGYQNSPFSAFLLQKKFGKNLVLGTELYGHGAQNTADDGGQHAVLLDFGGFYSFNEHVQLMLAGGHSVVWQAETYTYAAIYWTWGKGPDDKEDTASANKILALH